MTRLANLQLTGFANPKKGAPGFLIPVYEHDKQLFVMDGPELAQPVEYDAASDRFLRLLDSGTQTVNGQCVNFVPSFDVLENTSLRLRAFLFPRNDVLCGTESAFREHLRSRIAEVEQFTFLYLEVCRYLGMKEEAQETARRASALLFADAPLRTKWLSLNYPEYVSSPSASTTGWLGSQRENSGRDTRTQPGAGAGTETARIEIDDSQCTADYANFCRVSNTPEELVLDFGLNPHPYAVGEVTVNISQRIVMSHFTTKRLINALTVALRRHEFAFGSIETDVPKRVRMPEVF